MYLFDVIAASLHILSYLAIKSIRCFFKSKSINVHFDNTGFKTILSTMKQFCKLTILPDKNITYSSLWKREVRRDFCDEDII